MEKLNRPVDLPLLRIRLPVGGVVSILHRITGVLLVAALPLATYWLGRSLDSPAGFEATVHALDSVWFKLAVIALIALFIQHLVSGIRHLLLDLHIGIDRVSARISAWMVLVISVLITASIAWVLFL